jgi:hypothetical protein
MVTTGTAGARTADEDRAHDTACHTSTTLNAHFMSRTKPTSTHGSPPLATGCTRRSPTTSRSSQSATPRTCGDSPTDARTPPGPRQPFDQGAATHDHLPHCVAQHPRRTAPN